MTLIRLIAPLCHDLTVIRWEYRTGRSGPTKGCYYSRREFPAGSSWPVACSAGIILAERGSHGSCRRHHPDAGDVRAAGLGVQLGESDSSEELAGSGCPG